VFSLQNKKSQKYHFLRDKLELILLKLDRYNQLNP
jgi:hypothetical protein